MADMDEFDIGARIFLQVDLEGHSAWMANAKSIPTVVRDRAAFAKALRALLAKRRFALLSWKGDGGVYHLEYKKTNDFTAAVEAAVAAAEEFHRWRGAREDRSKLRLRASLHHAAMVYIHEDEGYWASDDLNVFLKYEREIGVSGTVAVTQAIFPHLLEPLQNAFAYSRPMRFSAPRGAPLISAVHYMPLPHEAGLNNLGRHGFFEWMKLLDLPEIQFIDPTIGPKADMRLSLGESSFLFAAPAPDSPFAIELVQTGARVEPELNKAEKEQWELLQARLVASAREENKEDGRKVSARRIVRPLSDIPLARIEYAVDTWSRVRAFHRLMESDGPARERLAEEILDVQLGGFKVPTITCCHMVIRTADEGAANVLIAQRQLKGPEDTYHAGAWSISVEEQMRPSESIEACVSRGLAEELLGEEGTRGAKVRVLGAIIEKYILNLGIIVLVELPLTMSQILETWQRAIDKDEHRQLGLIALDRAVFAGLCTSGLESEFTRSAIQPAHPKRFATNTVWKLHPTALARVAMCLWAEETS
jgi:hypothetical protein